MRGTASWRIGTSTTSRAIAARDSFAIETPHEFDKIPTQTRGVGRPGIKVVLHDIHHRAKPAARDDNLLQEPALASDERDILIQATEPILSWGKNVVIPEEANVLLEVCHYCVSTWLNARGRTFAEVVGRYH